MATGYLIAETTPSSPETIDEYHDWYDNVHIPEILALDGFVAARRLEPVEGTSFVAIYEIDGIDVETAIANLQAAQATGTMSTPVGVVMDPRPTARYYREITFRSA